MPDFHECAFCSLNRTEEEILFDYRLRSNRAVVTSTIVTHSFRVHTRCTRLLTIVGHLVSRKFRGRGAMRIEILIFIRFIYIRFIYFFVRGGGEEFVIICALMNLSRTKY